MVSRYVGEEFLVVFPDAGLPEILERAEAMRQAFESGPTVFDGQSLPATFSGGISSYPDNGKSLGDLVKAADRAMYQAKKAGRNRIIVAG